MYKILFPLAIICFFAVTTDLIARERKSAALNPDPITSGVSDVEINLIVNQLQSELSRYYKLISKREYQRAFKEYQDQVENEMECSSVGCIQFLQDQYQLSHIFALMIIRQGRLTQLTLNLARLEDNLTATVGCTECDISMLINKVEELVYKMVKDDLGEDVADSSSAFLAPSTAPSNIRAEIQRVTPVVTGNKRSKTATLVVNTVPNGASVYLGDTFAGTSPHQFLRLQAGQTIHITVKHPEFYDKTIELSLKGGRNEIAPIKLETKYGRLSISSEPSGAEVFLAGKNVGKTPYQNQQILSGAYLVTLKYPLYFPIENQRVAVAAGKLTERHFTLSSNYGEVDVRTFPEGANIRVMDSNGNDILRSSNTNTPMHPDITPPNLDYADSQKEHRFSSPAKLRLPPGKFQLILEKEGYSSIEFNVVVSKGSKQKITEKEAVLRRLEGELVVASKSYYPDAEVIIDGDNRGSPPVSMTLPQGKHKVVIETDTKEASETVYLEDGEVKELILTLEEKLSYSEKVDIYNLWKWKLGGAIAGGVILAFNSLNEFNDAQSARNKQESFLKDMMDAASYEEARAYESKANAKNSEVKEHNENSRNRAIASFICLGVAAWLWIDQPENPDNHVWSRSANQGMKNYLWTPVFKANDEIALSWQVKW